MRRAGLVVLALVAALPAAAHAASSYCSPSGDLCMQARKRDGILRIQLDTFSMRGLVRTCVSKGDEVDCKRFRLRSSGRRILGIDVRWSACPAGFRR